MPTALRPCCSRSGGSRRLISSNASSHVASTSSPLRRTSGVRRRSGSSCSAPRLPPFGQMKPFEKPPSLAPRTRVTLPSSASWSSSPQVASHSGQVVYATPAITGPYRLADCDGNERTVRRSGARHALLRDVRRTHRSSPAADHGPGHADGRLARRLLPPAGGSRLLRDPLRQPRQRQVDVDEGAADHGS